MTRFSCAVAIAASALCVACVAAVPSLTAASLDSIPSATSVAAAAVVRHLAPLRQRRTSEAVGATPQQCAAIASSLTPACQQYTEILLDDLDNPQYIDENVIKSLCANPCLSQTEAVLDKLSAAQCSFDNETASSLKTDFLIAKDALCTQSPSQRYCFEDDDLINLIKAFSITADVCRTLASYQCCFGTVVDMFEETYPPAASIVAQLAGAAVSQCAADGVRLSLTPC
eukprot:m.327685 g.327685  ORF g.327685 m.327685 type:complete len:228 (+) comp19748_c3_seq24:5191-5874(+)